MSSTIRIDEEAKQRLRRLQEAWARLRGDRPTQKELIGEGLAFLEDHRQAFLDEVGWEPFSLEEIEEVEQRARSMGDWSARDVDETVYGSSDRG